MNLSDADFELLFGLYDAAFEFIPEKDKATHAEDWINILLDNGFDLKMTMKEVADHCEYLSDALDAHFEQEEEDEDIFEEWNEDDDDDW